MRPNRKSSQSLVLISLCTWKKKQSVAIKHTIFLFGFFKVSIVLFDSLSMQFWPLFSNGLKRSASRHSFIDTTNPNVSQTNAQCFKLFQFQLMRVTRTGRKLISVVTLARENGRRYDADVGLFSLHCAASFRFLPKRERPF